MPSIERIATAIIAGASLAGCGAMKAGVGVIDAATAGAEAIAGPIRRSSARTAVPTRLSTRPVIHRDAPPIDISNGTETAVVRGFEDGDTYCHISQPATTKSLVVNEGETALTAVCRFLRSRKQRWREVDSPAWIFSQFDFIARSGHTYRVELSTEALVALTELSEASANQAVAELVSIACASLVDESAGELVACEPVSELLRFNGFDQMATSDESVEIRGGSYLCGLRSLLYLGEYQRVVLDPGRARITAYCYKPDRAADGGQFYYADFDIDSLPGEAYLVWREDEIEEDPGLIPANGDCMSSPDRSKEVRIFLCKA